MRIPIIAVTLSFSLLPLNTSFAQNAEKHSLVAIAQADEQKLREIEASLLKAENENSKELFAGLLAADFHTLTPNGRTFDRAQVLQDTAERAKVHFPYRVEHSGMHIFLVGNTAVVAYTKDYVGSEGKIAGKVRKQEFVDVFTKDDSGWKLHFTKADRDAESH